MNRTRIFNLSGNTILTSRREKIIHGAIWLMGWAIVNQPALALTMGVFYSVDLSLLIPSIYGSLLNGFLFYWTAGTIMQHFKNFDLKILIKIVLVFLMVGALESALDAVYDTLFYRGDLSFLFDIITGNLLLNFIFFLMPSVVFGIIKGWRYWTSHQDEKVLVRDGGKRNYFAPHEIYFLESDGNYVKYNTVKGIILERASMSHASENLPTQFIRCHRSFIVNSDLITRLQATSLLIGETKIPIGRKYRPDFEKRFETISRVL